MPRAIWKGAVNFGLVHVPVALYPAAQDSSIDFDWLDKRSMDPVGYKRVNKRTGREIQKEHIVKGIKQADDSYVILSDEQIRQAYPKSTQSIEIEGFVKAPEVSFPLLETPYYLTPLPKAEKVYALLREAMAKAGVIAVARVVMHTKERLCVLVPSGPALMLNTIRWASELRDTDELAFPPEGSEAAGLKDAELKMAGQLIDQMTIAWKPEAFADKFVAAIGRLVEAKLKAGDTETVQPLEDAPATEGSNVVDLSALLKQSLSGARKPPKTQGASAKRPAAVAKTVTKAATKAARKRA